MKNTIDIDRLNHDFNEFLHEVKSDFFDFKENLKEAFQEDQQDNYPPSEVEGKDQVVIRLIEECMEEQQYWIIGEAFNKAVRLVQTYGNTYGNYRYSFGILSKNQWSKTFPIMMLTNKSNYDF